MATEDRYAVVGRLWQQVFNEGNLEVADELFASDHVMRVSELPAGERGPYATKGLVAMLHKTLPGIQLDLQDEIAVEDKVVSRWMARGSLADELKGAGSGDEEVAISGISIFRVSDGEIRESWHQFDVLRDAPESLRLPEGVRERWLGDDEQIREFFEDSEWIEAIVCRICRCC